MPASVSELLERAIKQRPDDAAAMVKTDGTYRDVSWRQIGIAVDRLACSLSALGVRQGDRVGISLTTGLDWVALDLAVLALGGITVPLHPSGPSARARHVLSTAAAKLVFVSHPSLVTALSTERVVLPELEHVISLDDGVIGDWHQGSSGSSPVKHPPADAAGELDGAAEQAEGADGELPWHLHWPTFTRLGRGQTGRVERPRLSADDILTILFTEGTTDKPKGVVLTHGALIYQAEALLKADLLRPTDKQLLFLPLTHAFARLLVVGWLYTQHVMAFAERADLAVVARNLREVRPSVVAVVPRVVEEWAELINERGRRRFGVLFERARSLALREGSSGADRLSAVERLQLLPLRPLLRQAGAGLIERLGGRLRLCVSGGAPLAVEAQQLMNVLGLKVLQGYGLTEAGGAITIDRPRRPWPGSVGLPLDGGTEVRVANDGEVLARGPGMMRGYWRDPAASAEAFTKDGWLRTGDLGRQQGTRLWLTGRKSAVILTSTGERIAPAVIEKQLRRAPLVAHAMVCGDGEPYPVALIVLDPVALDALGEVHGFGGATYAVLSQRPEVRLEVDRLVREVNTSLQPRLAIRNFALMRRHFTAQSGELTTSGALRRSEILVRHAAEIRRLYAHPPPDMDSEGRAVRR